MANDIIIMPQQSAVPLFTAAHKNSEFKFNFKFIT